MARQRVTEKIGLDAAENGVVFKPSLVRLLGHLGIEVIFDLYCGDGSDPETGG